MIVRPAKVLLVGTGMLLLASLVSVAARAGEGAPTAEAPKRAGMVRAVIELFTSQGCSSCPPADALLVEYAGQGDVIALTLPVDYWDYLGWKDTFGTPKNTQRQRAYSAKRGDGMVYTPQAVINGRKHCNGAGREKIEKAIAETKASFEASRVPVAIHLDRSDIVIEAGDRGAASVAGPGAPPSSRAVHATVWLATVQAHAEVEVRKGENRGNKLIYANVVRDLTPVGMFEGRPMTIRLDKRAVLGASGHTLAVIVQENASGPILGAAMLPPPTN